MIVVGLSSGTSADGIDVAAADLRLHGDTVTLALLGHRTAPYPPDVHDLLTGALPPATTDLATVCRIDTGVGQAFAATAVAAVDDLCGGRADLVVSHGQTLYHWVDAGTVRGSLQLGQAAWIAEATGAPVVCDVRARDIAAGGQGAPLASVLDVLLLGDREGPAVALNLGGIANVTIVAPGTPPVAFDTGPANALIDAAARWASGGRETHDHDGRRAARGTVDAGLLADLLADPYYGLAPPKSTGRELFHAGYLQRVVAGRDIAGDDLLATVTVLTARTVADACHPHGPAEAVVSGGGVHNPVLMAALRDALAPARVATSDELGLPVDAKEAVLFALLGFLTWHGVPGTVPACTGARAATLAGAIVPGAGPLVLPPPAVVPPVRLVVERS